MTIKAAITRSFLAVGIFAASAFAAGNAVTVRPSGPTHYMFTPMAQVNGPYHIVTGLHELSFALPYRLQIQASIIDNIGKTNFGIKYGLADNLSIGGGLAGSLIDMGEHGIWQGEERVGLYLTYGISNSKRLDMAVTPHIQIGDRVSLGADLGIMMSPTDIWSFMLEFGLSADTHKDDGGLYLFTAGGLRLNFPAIPFMYFDVGVATNEFSVKGGIKPVVFIDIMACFITN